MKYFTVIIPNLHTPSIDRAIASLENQTFEHRDFEVIVVGMDRYNRVKDSSLVRFDRSDRPLSPAQARNRGAAQSQAEVVVFIDADCAAHPDWLSIFYDCFRSSERQVIGGGIEFDAQNYWTLADNLSMFHDYMATLPPGEKKQLPSLNLAIRRVAFNDIGGFDERYPRASGEDADLTIRLRRKGCRLYFEPRAIVKHAPGRDRLIDLLRHGYYQGMYSTKVDPRYAGQEGLAFPFRSRAGLLIGSPLLAPASALNMFRVHPKIRRYWYTLPAVLLAKLAWCFGAANRPPW